MRRRGAKTKTEVSDEVLKKVDANRRSFVGKIIVGTVFAAPVVSSFSMDGLSSASAQVMYSGNVT